MGRVNIPTNKYVILNGCITDGMSTVLRCYIRERGKTCRKSQKVRGAAFVLLALYEQNSLSFRKPLIKMGKSLQNIWRNLVR
jgi:hypothetical protein